MSIGTTVRSKLGRYETTAADAYRAAFLDLNAFADYAAALVPPGGSILEVGCGDGSVADRMLARCPGARYTGIDVSPEPGRRFTGDRTRASFESMLTSQLRARSVEAFDVVLIVDVLHHVQVVQRVALVEDAAAMTSPGGTLLVKEWERRRSVGYALGALSDKYVSGDRGVQFLTLDELRALISTAAPSMTEVACTTVRPWACNALVQYRSS